jgi:hypothetical protein
MRTWLVLCIVVTLFPFPSAIAQPAASAPKPWTAQWITAPGAPSRDEAVLHFHEVATCPGSK